MTFQPARLSKALAIIVAATAIASTAIAQNVATVNGTPIPSSRIDDMIRQISAQPNAPKDTPELRQKIKEELITREVLLQAANKLGLAKNPEVKEQIEMARQAILLRALGNDFVKKNPVSDAAIKAEYDRIVKEAGDKEYNVRHILVATEPEAKAIIAKLKAGESFEELAKKESKDPGSASNGGDLTWATPTAFVKEFSDAMVSLKKGQMTEAPVKTQFGYHIIKVDDIRQARVPDFDTVKKQVAEGLEQKKWMTYQEDLRNKATIK